MDQIPSSIKMLFALVIVAIAATIAQRKWGSKALLGVWITSAVIITGATLFWPFYKQGFPSAQELFAVTFLITHGSLKFGAVSKIVVRSRHGRETYHYQ